MKNIGEKISQAMMALFIIMAGVLFLNGGMQAEAEGQYSASVSSLEQTGWETNAVTIGWELSYERNEETAGYKIYLGTTYSDLSQVATCTGTSYRLAGLQDGKQYYVRVVPYSVSGAEATVYGSKMVETVPASVKNFKQNKWWYFIQVLDVKWDRIDTADQIIVTLYNSKGKQVGKPTALNGHATSTSFSKMKDEVYTVTIRAQKTVNGKTYTTPVSKIQCFNQARIKTAKVKNKKLTIIWGKVGGATGYDIYVSTNKVKGYKKVKSVGKNVSKATISKFKGKAFNSKKRYYVYVETKKKSGRRVDKSGRLYYWNTKDTSSGYF